MRLLSYNIHKGIGGRDRKYRIGRVIQVIEDQNPDLICLQEVARGSRRSWYDDQPRLLADHFRPADWLFQANVTTPFGGYGNLILSRWPITARHQFSLRLNKKKPRGAQLAVIQTPEGPLQLVNWHLGLAEKERHWQVEQLLGQRSFCEGGELPALVVGDSNDWRNTLCQAAFALNGFQHVTHPRSRFRSFPAWLPVSALDKAFCRGPIQVRTARIVRSRLAKRASDHLPLLVDFHLSESSLDPPRRSE